MRIKYKGEYIVDSSDKTKKLLTKGRFCEDDIEIEASGGGATIVAELGDSSLQVGDRVMVTNLVLGNYNLNIANSVVKDNGIVTNVYSGDFNTNITFPDVVETVDFYIRAKMTNTDRTSSSTVYQLIRNNEKAFWGLSNYSYPALKIGVANQSGKYVTLTSKPNVWMWFKVSQVNEAKTTTYYMDDVGYSLEEVISRTDWTATNWGTTDIVFTKGNNYIDVYNSNNQSNYYDLSAMAFVVNGELVWRGCEVSHDKFTAFLLGNYRGEIYSTGVIESLNEDGTANVQVVEPTTEEVTLSTVDSEDYYSNLKLVVGGKDE